MPRRHSRYHQPELVESIAQAAQVSILDVRDDDGHTWSVQDFYRNADTKAITGMTIGWTIATHRIFKRGTERVLYTFLDEQDSHANTRSTLLAQLARGKRLGPRRSP